MVSSIVLLVAGVLWALLASAGDQAGSQGAKGVALVAIGCLVLDLATMLVLLAIAEITRGDEPSGNREPARNHPRDADSIP